MAATWFGTRNLRAILGVLYVAVGIAAPTVAGGHRSRPASRVIAGLGMEKPMPWGRA
jgi:hypothetical protein